MLWLYSNGTNPPCTCGMRGSSGKGAEHFDLLAWRSTTCTSLSRTWPRTWMQSGSTPGGNEARWLPVRSTSLISYPRKNSPAHPPHPVHHVISSHSHSLQCSLLEPVREPRSSSRCTTASRTPANPKHTPPRVWWNSRLRALLRSDNCYEAIPPAASASSRERRFYSQRAYGFGLWEAVELGSRPIACIPSLILSSPPPLHQPLSSAPSSLWKTFWVLAVRHNVCRSLLPSQSSGDAGWMLTA